MIVVVDHGATNSRWWYGEKHDEQGTYFELKGFNPRTTSTETIRKTLSQASLNLPDKSGELFFYSTGVAGSQLRNQLKRYLKDIFPKLTPEVQTDLTAVGRAILGEYSGIVGILGTGSNAGLYENHQVIHQPVSLGFILGDEGSGAYIGKKLLKDYLEDRMPYDIAAAFAEKYSSDKKKLVSEISNIPSGSKLAAFAAFAKTHRKVIYIENLLKDAFDDFFRNVVARVEGNAGEIGVSGSIAWTFSDIFTEVAKDFGYAANRFIKDPMHDLVYYHKRVK